MGKTKIRINSDKLFTIETDSEKLMLSRGLYSFITDSFSVSNGGKKVKFFADDYKNYEEISILDDCQILAERRNDGVLVSGFTAGTDTSTTEINKTETTSSGGVGWMISSAVLFFIFLAFAILIGVLVFALKVKIAKKIIK